MFTKLNGILNKKSSGSSNQSNSYYMQLTSANWMRRDYEKFADEAYIKNVIAHRAIAMIAQAAASVPFRLFDVSAQQKKLLQQHPILSILSKPNPKESGKEFLESLYTYLQISGNAYVLANLSKTKSEPLELYSLRPDRLSIEMGGNFLPKSYIYKIEQEFYEYPVNPLSGKCLVMHVKNFNPLSDHYGLSSIEAAAYSIDQHNQAGEWNQALLQNGARPSGAIIVKSHDGSPNRLTEKQYSELKNMVDEVFCSPKNAGRPILLEGGLDWREMSMSPKDMDFIESKHSSARDIALALGMPPQLLGIPGDNTYSNLQEARMAFWEQTIIPMVEKVVENLNNWLCQFYKEKLELTFDIDGISALSEKREMLWSRLNKCDFLTTNEKRAMVGLAPLEEKENR